MLSGVYRALCTANWDPFASFTRRCNRRRCSLSTLGVRAQKINNKK